MKDNLGNFLNLMLVFITFFSTILSIMFTIDINFNENKKITGPRGSPGQRGSRGITGFRGPIGKIGPRGIRGDTGLPGEKSDKSGLTGKSGLKGNKGDRGVRGFRGIQGGRGIIGETGPDGFNGLMGNRGNIGPTGFDGPNPKIEFGRSTRREQFLDMEFDSEKSLGCNAQQDRQERVLNNKKVTRELFVKGIDFGTINQEKRKFYANCAKMKIGHDIKF